MKTYKAIMRARMGVDIVGELEVESGTDRLVVESFIESGEHMDRAKTAKKFLSLFYPGCIVTMEMKVVQ